jgi:hypothetical protein
MPLRKGNKYRSENFEEFGRGKTYRKMKKRKGTRAANKQRIAVILSNERRNKRR